MLPSCSTGRSQLVVLLDAVGDGKLIYLWDRTATKVLHEYSCSLARRAERTFMNASFLSAVRGRLAM
jgi:hypothetical protein